MLITTAKLWNQPEAKVAGVENGVLLCHKEVQIAAAEMAQISEVLAMQACKPDPYLWSH